MKSIEEQDKELVKILTKLLGRIERLLVNVNSVCVSPYPDLLEYFIKTRVRGTRGGGGEPRRSKL